MVPGPPAEHPEHRTASPASGRPRSTAAGTSPAANRGDEPFIISGYLWPDSARAPVPGWIEVERSREHHSPLPPAAPAPISGSRGRILTVCPLRDAPPPCRPLVDGLADHPAGPLLISPGFIDAHFHVPQIGAIGHDGHELLEWLERFIFPAEARWADPAEARADCDIAFRRMLAAGTLGGAGYLTSHNTGPAAAVAAASGLPGGGPRLLLGRVLMDRDCPAPLRHDPAQVAAALDQGHPTDWLAPSLPEPGRMAGVRIDWSVNPRFAVSCTAEALEAARRLSLTPHARGGVDGDDDDATPPAAPPPRGRVVQTHLAETIAECRLVAEQFPEARDYLAVYEAHGLVHERSLLAHAIHLGPDAWDRIARARAVVVHCPTANLFLEAGSFDLATAVARGARIALGSDVAAGPDIAMPRVARAMIDNLKWRRMTGLTPPSVPPPTAADAWRMITAGNADALGWYDSGRLAPGAAADLLLLRPGRRGIDLRDADLAARLIYNWSNMLIERRVINGVMDGSALDG